MNKNNEISEIYYSRKQMSLLLGVSYNLLTKWEKIGKLIPDHKIKNRYSYYSHEQLNEVVGANISKEYVFGELEKFLPGEFELRDKRLKQVPRKTKEINRRVICINNNEIFSSPEEASKNLGLKNGTGVRQSCRNILSNKYTYAGKTNEDIYFWMYHKDYLNMKDDELQEIKNKVEQLNLTRRIKYYFKNNNIDNLTFNQLKGIMSVINNK